MLDLGKLEESFYSSLLIQFTFICFFTPYLLIAGLVSYVFNICIIVLVMALYTKITRRPISRRVGNIEIWNQLYNMISYLGIIFNAIVIVTTGDQLGADVLERIVPGNRSSFRTVFDAQNALLVVKFLLSIMIPKLPQWIGEMQMRERLVRERERKKNSKILTRLSKERIKKEIDEKKKAFANAKKLKKDKIKQNRIQEKIKAQAMVLEDDDTRSLKYFFENNKKMEVFEKMSFRVNSKTEEMMEMPRPRIEVKKVKKTNRKKLDNGY